MENILPKVNIHSSIIDEFMSLCLSPNFRKFKSKMYTFSEGVPIGSPLAPLIRGGGGSWIAWKETVVVLLAIGIDMSKK